MEHTPGPWEVTKAEPGLQTIVHLRGYAVPPDNIASVYWVEGGKGTIRANARLIASAPALLEALEKALEHRFAADPLWCGKARDAIKAAKGE